MHSESKAVRSSSFHNFTQSCLEIIFQYMRSHTKADEAEQQLMRFGHFNSSFSTDVYVAFKSALKLLYKKWHTKDILSSCMRLCTNSDPELDIFNSLWHFDMMWPALRFHHRCTQRDFDKEIEWVHGHKVASFSECWMVTVPTVRSYPTDSTICMYHDMIYTIEVS